MRRIARLFRALAVTLTAAFSLVFTSAAMAATPTVTTGAASAVTPTTATVSGTVNLNGASLSLAPLASTCYFEYGTSTSYGSTATCSTTPAATGTTTVTAALTGLGDASTDHYQLVVVTGGTVVLGAPVGATSTPGGDQSFTTPSTSVPPTAATGSASAVGSNSATLNGTANAENWTITGCSFSYTPSGGTATTVPCSSTPSGTGNQNVSADIGSGLSSGTTYSDSLTLTYDNGATVTSSSSGSFTTMSLSVAAPSSLAATTATLSGTVNPEGQTITACTFYYGVSVTSLKTAPCSVAAGQITGTSNISVSADVTGLSQKSTYADTVVLATSGGAVGLAVPATFTTLAVPTAVSTAATGVTTTTATLQATVNAGGAGVRACAFEYGVTPLTSASPSSDPDHTEYCATTPAASGSQKPSLAITGLVPGTTYYFRVLFVTDGGFVVANTESFKTLVNTPTPSVKITRSTINTKARTARFAFARTGSVTATKGFECALVTVTKGKAGTAHYATCKSATTYKKLKAATYVFYVRGGSAAGYGKAASHRFVA